MTKSCSLRNTCSIILKLKFYVLFDWAVKNLAQKFFGLGDLLYRVN